MKRENASYKKILNMVEGFLKIKISFDNDNNYIYDFYFLKKKIC